MFLPIRHEDPPVIFVLGKGGVETYESARHEHLLMLVADRVASNEKLMPEASRVASN